jgi:hypothetical protein
MAPFLFDDLYQTPQLPPGQFPVWHAAGVLFFRLKSNDEYTLFIFLLPQEVHAAFSSLFLASISKSFLHSSQL